MPFSSIFTKVSMLLILMLIGFVSAKIGWIGPEFKKHATPVTFNVFLSCMMLNSAIGTTLVLSGRDLLLFLLLMTLLLAVCGAVGWAVTAIFRLPRHEAGMARAAIMFMNNGYIGYPVVQALFGLEAVFYISLSNIPFNLLLYSLGAMQLGGRPGQKFDWRPLLSMPMLACIASVFVFVLQPPIPQLAADCISTLAGAAIPMVLIIIGASLSEIPFKSALGDWRVYLVSFGRLILCPVAFRLLLGGFISDPLLMGVLLTMCACPCAMLLPALCLRQGLDDAFVSKSILVSTVLCVFTIPLMLSILM